MMRLYSLMFVFLFAAVFAVKANDSNERTAPQLYRKYCVSCHGTDGRAKTSKGKFSHARDLTEAQWQDEVTDERIFNSIMNGRSVRGNMPAFSNKIDQKEAESLVNFVRRFSGARAARAQGAYCAPTKAAGEPPALLQVKKCQELCLQTVASRPVQFAAP